MDKQLFLMKRMILLCVVCVLGFLSLICYPAKKAKAEEKLPPVMAADIGKRYGKGLSNPCVSGVRIARNNLYEGICIRCVFVYGCNRLEVSFRQSIRIETK